MSRVLVFQHVAAEPLGTLDPLIRRSGHRIRFVNFERDPEASPEIDGYAGLVVLGGPMNVSDREHRRHLLTEMRVIEAALRQDKPILGICLGAQLLAHVLGARVDRHPVWEIGWYPLHATAGGLRDPVLAPLGPCAPVFQWHGCSFEIPASAEHLARTEACEAQAFRYGERAYGFQFHLEVDQRLIERWLSSPGTRRELEAAGFRDQTEAIRAQTRQQAAATAALAEPVFERFLDLIGRPERRVVLPSR